MNLEEEVDEIERELSDLSERLDAFQRRAKQTIAHDQEVMLARLRAGVQSVEQTVLLLETGNSRWAGLLTYGTMSGSSRNELSTVVVENRVSEMNETFLNLRQAADVGLQNVKRINGECHDLDAELDAIRAALKSVTDRTWRSLSSAKDAFAVKQKEQKQAEASCNEYRQKLRELESDMNGRVENRNAMRVVSRDLIKYEGERSDLRRPGSRLGQRRSSFLLQ